MLIFDIVILISELLLYLAHIINHVPLHSLLVILVAVEVIIYVLDPIIIYFIRWIKTRKSRNSFMKRTSNL